MVDICNEVCELTGSPYSRCGRTKDPYKGMKADFERPWKEHLIMKINRLVHRNIHKLVDVFIFTNTYIHKCADSVRSSHEKWKGKAVPIYRRVPQHWCTNSIIGKKICQTLDSILLGRKKTNQGKNRNQPGRSFSYSCFKVTFLHDRTQGHRRNASLMQSAQVA